jgi:RNA polymerase sigma-70 factor (ECF subfamily)
MRRAQDGDQAAYRMVLRAIVPAIRRIVARRIFDEALVEDAVQDTLMTIHRLRHTYDPARPLMPWVAAIATSRAIDALRRRAAPGGLKSWTRPPWTPPSTMPPMIRARHGAMNVKWDDCWADCPRGKG